MTTCVSPSFRRRQGHSHDSIAPAPDGNAVVRFLWVCYPKVVPSPDRRAGTMTDVRGRSMPSPREQPNPPGRPRRRPEAMPGSWLWLVLLLMLVLVLLVTVGVGSGAQLDYTDVLTLAKMGKGETSNS